MKKRPTKNAYDAIIVGTGPAGASAAHALASAGKNVIAIDSQRFPRYKSCGGFLSRKVEGILPFNFSEVVEKTIDRATLTYKSGSPVEFKSNSPLGVCVMRDRFDALLADRACRAGAQIMYGCRITEITEDESSVTAISANGETFKADFLVAAHGAGEIKGASMRSSKDEYDLTLTAEVKVDPDEIERTFGNGITIDLGGIKSGYAWIFPKKETLSIGMSANINYVRGAELKSHFKKFVEKDPALKGRDIGKITGWQLPLRRANTRAKPIKGRIAFTGDAGLTVDPFLGEGIYFAILSGQKAALAINDCLENRSSDLRRYASFIQENIYADFGYAEKLAKIIYSHPKIYFTLAKKNQSIMLRYFDVIGGREDYKSFYNWLYSRIKNKPLDLINKLALKIGFKK